MPGAVHFEVFADDVERAKRFYGAVFGWEFEPWGDPAAPCWLVTSRERESRVDAAVAQRHDEAQGLVPTLDVSNVDATVAAVTRAGGRLAVPPLAFPSEGRLAYCTDPEGNTFGLRQVV